MKYFGIIYKAENVVNHKVYIGQSRDFLSHRKCKHFSSAFNHHSELYFHRALRKYGKESFVWEVIDHGDTPEELDELERKYITFYNSNNSEFGYNLTRGGLDSLPDNNKAVICLETQERYTSMKEALQKIGVCHEFLLKSIREHTSINFLHYMQENEPYTLDEIVLTFSEKKIQQMQKFTSYQDMSKWGGNTARSKPVLCIEAGVIFPSGKSASLFMETTKDNVGATCRGVQETCGGLHWRYLTEQELSIWKETHHIFLKDYK